MGGEGETESHSPFWSSHYVRLAFAGDFGSREYIAFDRPSSIERTTGLSFASECQSGLRLNPRWCASVRDGSGSVSRMSGGSRTRLQSNFPWKRRNNLQRRARIQKAGADDVRTI